MEVFMKVEKLSPIPPRTLGNLDYSTATMIAKNVYIIHPPYSSESINSLVVLNYETGERIKIVFGDQGEQPGSFTIDDDVKFNNLEVEDIEEKVSNI